jgi:hypothetical protein
LNFFLVITIGNLSLFFFSYPATLPKVFYLFPHSCIIRGLYYQVKACVEGACIQSPREIEVEHWVALCLPFVHFLVYFGLGLAFGESRVASKLKAMLEFRRRTFTFSDLLGDGNRQPQTTEQSVEMSASRPTAIMHRGAGQLTTGPLDGVRELPGR